MKKQFFVFLFTLTFTLGLLGIPSLSQAYTSTYKYKTVCKTVGGKYVDGRYIPRHRSCWRVKTNYRSGYHSGYHHGRCYWVDGHYWRGHYVPGHRICP
jgi:hypothetical protein